MISFLSYDIVMSLVIAICFYCGSDAVPVSYTHLYSASSFLRSGSVLSPLALK